MNSEFLNQAIHLIESKYGLKPNVTGFQTWNEVLKERMLACNLSSFDDYLLQLQMSPEEEQELVERIMIPETWFFRNKEAFEFLSLVAKESQFKPSFLKVLSLACSTGEEPYSIAMALFDAGLAKQDFIIDAIDINKKALIKAQIGLYGSNSFRGKDLSYRNRYFDETKEGDVIKDIVKGQVHFYYGNILDERLAFDFPFYQVIFCCNLLIYLNQEARQSVLDCIKDLLAPNGVLIVGAAETQIIRNAGFVSSQFANPCAFTLKQEMQTQITLPNTSLQKLTQEITPSISQPKLTESSVALSSQLFSKAEEKPALLQETSSVPKIQKQYKASKLFERTPTQEYIEEWTNDLMQPQSSENSEGILSVIVFRLGEEWFALPTICIKEVSHCRAIHQIPHRTNNTLLGVINLNGELQLYVALHRLLEVDSSADIQTIRIPYQQERMIAIVKDRDLWVFPVAEIDGIYKWDLTKLENVPVSVSRSSANYVKGIMKKENRSVGLLDEELLFASLKRSIQ